MSDDDKKMKDVGDVKEEEAAETRLDSIPAASHANNFEDDFAALNFSSSATPAKDYGQLMVAVPRDLKKTNGNVEYELIPRDYFDVRYKGTADAKDYPWVVREENGATRTLPRAYYSADLPPGTRGAAVTQGRKENWARMEEAWGYKTPPYAGKTSFDALSPDDPKSRIPTTAGVRYHKYGYTNPKMAGTNMPEVEVRIPSNNSRGERILVLQKDNPRFLTEAQKPMTPQQLGEKFGPDEVRMGDADGRWDSIADLNQRGRYEADRRLAETYGQKFAYNAQLPEMVVEARADDPRENQLVSMDLIRDAGAHSKNPGLARMSSAVDRAAGNMRVGVKINESTYVSPSFAAQKYPEIYKSLKVKYALPDKFERIGTLVDANKAWVQTSKGVFDTAATAQSKLPKGKTIAGHYNDVRIFTAKTTIKPGTQPGTEQEVTGNSLKMLYTSMRDRDTIPPSIAKEIGVATQRGHYDERKLTATNQIAPQKLEDARGYESSDDEAAARSNARQTMVGKRARQGRTSSLDAVG